MKTLVKVVVLALATVGYTHANAGVQYIRGGEHGAFTRFFLPGVADGAASLAQTGGEIHVNLQSFSDEISAAEAMDRISGSRVHGVAVSDTGFTIRLNCRCGYEVSYLGNRGLIIDVSEDTAVKTPPSRIVSTSEVVVATAEGKPNLQTPVPMPIIPWADVRNKPKLDDYFEQALLDHSVHPTDHTQGAEPANQVHHLAATLSELGLAVRQPGDTGIEVISKAQEGSCGSLNLRPENWGYGESLFEELAEVRKIFDGSEEQKLRGDLELAKLYLSFGMASEAKLVLQSNPIITAEKQQLLDVVKVAMVGDDLDEQSKHAMACTTGASLWSVLSGQEADPLSDSQMMAITRDFLILPKYLRLSLAEEMKVHFASLGADEMVTIIDSNLQNTDHIIDREQVRVDRKTSQELAQVIDHAIALKGKIPAAMMDLSEATLFSSDDQNEANQLASSRFNAAIASGALRVAKAIIEQEVSDQTLSEQLISRLMIEASESRSNDVFLDIAFSYAPDTLSAQASSLRSLRLRELGFDVIRTEQPTQSGKPEPELATPAAPTRSLSEIDLQLARAQEINNRLTTLINQEPLTIP